MDNRIDNIYIDESDCGFLTVILNTGKEESLLLFYDHNNDISIDEGQPMWQFSITEKKLIEKKIELINEKNNKGKLLDNTYSLKQLMNNEILLTKLADEIPTKELNLFKEKLEQIIKNK